MLKKVDMVGYSRPFHDMKIECMEKFDWEGTRALMLMNKWIWGSLGRTPTIEEMKEKVEGLFVSLANSKFPSSKSATGGFTVCRWQWDTTWYLELYFVWKESEAYRNALEEAPEK